MYNLIIKIKNSYSWKSGDFVNVFHMSYKVPPAGFQIDVDREKSPRSN